MQSVIAEGADVPRGSVNPVSGFDGNPPNFFWHITHVFSESFSSGDDNDQDKDLQEDKYKDKDTQT